MTKCSVLLTATLLISSAVQLIDTSVATSCGGFIDSSSGICYVLHDDIPLSWQDASTACASSGDGFKLAWINNDLMRSKLRSYLVTNYSGNSALWLGGRTESLYANSFLWRWSHDMSTLTAQGCYNDPETGHDHDLPYEMTQHIVTMTTQSCVTACRSAGYLYAGLQAGTRCFCGNSYGSYPSVDTANEMSNCDTPCAGNSSEMCGSSNQTFVYKVTGAFALWGFARPNNWLGFQTCAILSNQVSLKIDDEDCGKPAFGYICDIPTSLCVDGSQMLNGTCYFISPSSTQTTWYLARMECIRRGGDLVSLTSLAMWLSLVSAIVPSTKSYWVGLSGLYWLWNNDTEITFFDWSYNSSTGYHPSIINNRCMVIDPLSSYQWIDENCDQLHYYVCMRGGTTSVTSVTPVSSQTTGIQQVPTQVPTHQQIPTQRVPPSEPRSTDKSTLDSTTIGLISICIILLVTLGTLGVVLYLYRKQKRLNKINVNYLVEEGATCDNTTAEYNYSSTQDLHKNTDDEPQDPVIGSPPWPNTYDYWTHQLGLRP